MHAAVNGQRRNSVCPGFLLQQRHTGLESQLREPTRRIDTHDRRGLIDHLRLGIGPHFAGAQRIDAAQNSVQTMGGTAIALASNHRGGYRLGVCSVETVVQQDRFGQRAGFDQGQSDHNQLLGQTVQTGPFQALRLERFRQD